MPLLGRPVLMRLAQSMTFGGVSPGRALRHGGRCCCKFTCFPVFFLEIGPASVMVGNLVSGKRIAQASGRDLGQIEDNDQARKVSARLGSSLNPVPPGSCVTVCRSLCTTASCFGPVRPADAPYHPPKGAVSVGRAEAWGQHLDVCPVLVSHGTCFSPSCKP